MDIVTRAEAIAKGLKRYFTGTPCKRGHVAERYCPQGGCVECENSRAAQNYESRRAYFAAYHIKNKGRIAAHRVANKEKIKAQRKVWRAKNRDKTKCYMKKWHKEHAYHNRQYQAVNKDRINHTQALWAKNNPGKMNAKVARRRSLKRNQTPNLTASEKLYIVHLYEDAALIGYQVDHIVPLAKGGLHHPDNLQIVSANYNRRKGDKEWGV